MSEPSSPDPAADETSSRRSLFARIPLFALVVLAVAWGIGQLFRDQSILTALCFYVPSPVLATLLVVTLLVGVWRRWRVRVLAVGLALLPVLVAIAVLENQWQAPAVAPTDPEAFVTHQVIHWNVKGGLFGWDRAATELVESKADLIVLSETPSGFGDDEIQLRFGEPYYGLQFGRLHVVGHGELTDRKWLYRFGGLTVASLRWKLDGIERKVFLVDLHSDPLLHREPLLLELLKLMKEHEPDLVLGDFNTPRRARLLDELPAGWRHAYRAAGAGWGYTWPTPIPVYAIDHALVREEVEVIGYHLETSSASLHRRQRMEIRSPRPADRRLPSTEPRTRRH
ncbi:MAG: endonuclease/exonuclease/phosphatase family protein [Planctomycetota bacterium]